MLPPLNKEGRVLGTGGSSSSRNGTSDDSDQVAFEKPKYLISERIKQFRAWLADSSAEEKNIYIRELLRQCEETNFEYLSTLIGQFRITDGIDAMCVSDSDSSLLRGPRHISDPILRLPAHVFVRVLAFLDPQSLCRSAAVSHSWREAALDDELWRAQCRHPRWWRLASSAAEAHQLEKHTSASGRVRWRAAFAERYRLWSNWHAGRCVVRTFNGHAQGISAVQFDSQRIVSGSSDTTIRLWDLRGEPHLGSMTLNGHSATVRCLHLEGNSLASGSNDSTIKYWNLDLNSQWSAIACRRTFLGHQNHVRCLQMVLDDGLLLSGSYDLTLKLWSLETGACIQTLTGHDGAVLCLHVGGSKKDAVSGSADMSIKCWDYRSGTTTMTIHKAHEQSVTCVKFADDGSRVVTGSLDRTIKVLRNERVHSCKMWDRRTGGCTQTIDWRLAEGHTGVVRCLQADAWRIVSAADDRTIKVWKMESGERLCTLHGHSDGVTCVQFNDQHIVSGSYDKTVRLWDFSV